MLLFSLIDLQEQGIYLYLLAKGGTPLVQPLMAEETDVSSISSEPEEAEYCKNVVWVMAHCCVDSHIPIRCRDYENCKSCRSHRMKVMYAKFFDRFSRAYPHLDKSQSRNFVMWTLGTNYNDKKVLVDDYGESEYPDFTRIRKAWAVFRKRLNIDRKRNPTHYIGSFQFYVIERGKAGYHHLHLIADGYMSHQRVTQIWRDVVDMNANVNFSNTNHTLAYGVSYILKYMLKDRSRYYWLDKLYKAGSTPYEKNKYHCPECNNLPDSFTYNVGYPGVNSYYHTKNVLGSEGSDDLNNTQI